MERGFRGGVHADRVLPQQAPRENQRGFLQGMLELRFRLSFERAGAPCMQAERGGSCEGRAFGTMRWLRALCELLSHAFHQHLLGLTAGFRQG